MRPGMLRDFIAATLPDVRSLRVPGAGHMGPITHADAVNAEILRFVRLIDRRPRFGLAA